MKERAIGCSNFNVQEVEVYLVEESQKPKEIHHLTEEMHEHWEEKPLVLSNEFIGSQFAEYVETWRGILRDDKVFIVEICGMREWEKHSY